MKFDQQSSDWRFVRRTFIVAGVVMLAAIGWLLTDVMLLVFASILFATLLRLISAPLVSVGARPAWAVGITTVLILGLAVVATGFYGAEVVAQARNVSERFYDASQRIADQFGITSFKSLVADAGGANITGLISKFFNFGMSLSQAIISVILIFVAAFYISLDPNCYKGGLIKLVPDEYQANVSSTLDDIGEAFRRWVQAQFFVMVLVGVLTATGLYIVGVRSALALGALAGFANFIPYVGSVAAAVVILVVASSQGGDYMAWAAGVMILEQQIEGNLITPVVVGRAVAIPPATGLLAIVAMGVLFGPLGVLLGFPLAIAVDITIRRLYVRDALDRDVTILGKPAERSQSTELN